MMKLLVLAVAFAAVHADVPSVRNIEGSITLATPEGSDVVLSAGDNDGSVVFDGVSFGADELAQLKELIAGQAADDALGSASSAKKGDAGVTLDKEKGEMWMGGADTGVYFTAAKAHKISQTTKEGSRVWSTNELVISVGDSITWTWTALESVAQTDANFRAFTPTDCEDMDYGCFTSGTSPSLGGEYSYTFHHPGTYFFGSRNTQTMIGKIVVKFSGIGAEGMHIEGDLDIHGDITIGGDLESPALAVLEAKLDDGIQAIDSVYNKLWGSPGRPHIRDWFRQTWSQTSSTYHGNGWRCRDPHCSCPSGKRIIGGGCRTHCHGSSRDQGIAQSYPEGEGWRCRGDIYHYMSAHCICV